MSVEAMLYQNGMFHTMRNILPFQWRVVLSKCAVDNCTHRFPSDFMPTDFCACSRPIVCRSCVRKRFYAQIQHNSIGIDIMCCPGCNTRYTDTVAVAQACGAAVVADGLPRQTVGALVPLVGAWLLTVLAVFWALGISLEGATALLVRVAPGATALMRTCVLAVFPSVTAAQTVLRTCAAALWAWQCVVAARRAHQLVGSSAAFAIFDGFWLRTFDISSPQLSHFLAPAVAVLSAALVLGIPASLAGPRAFVVGTSHWAFVLGEALARAAMPFAFWLLIMYTLGSAVKTSRTGVFVTILSWHLSVLAALVQLQPPLAALHRALVPVLPDVILLAPNVVAGVLFVAAGIAVHVAFAMIFLYYGIDMHTSAIASREHKEKIESFAFILGWITMVGSPLLTFLWFVGCNADFALFASTISTSWSGGLAPRLLWLLVAPYTGYYAVFYPFYVVADLRYGMHQWSRSEARARAARRTLVYSALKMLNDFSLVSRRMYYDFDATLPSPFFISNFDQSDNDNDDDDDGADKVDTDANDNNTADGDDSTALSDKEDDVPSEPTCRKRGRPRKYATNAERQAAYRARKQAKNLRTDDVPPSAPSTEPAVAPPTKPVRRRHSARRTTRRQ
jgi:hypothetical protein